MPRCVIVASGPSARGFVPPPHLTVIAVNGAIEWLSRADFFFTLDWSAENQHRLRHQRPGVRYAAAYPPEHRWEGAGVQWFDRIGPLRGKPGLSDAPGSIHTGNSAYGALGLAYHLGHRDVALTGVDADSRPRVEGGHSRSLAHLPALFASAQKQLRVVSCGAMGGIPQMPFADWLAEEEACSPS